MKVSMNNLIHYKVIQLLQSGNPEELLNTNGYCHYIPCSKFNLFFNQSRIKSFILIRSDSTSIDTLEIELYDKDSISVSQHPCREIVLDITISKWCESLEECAYD